MMKKLSRNEILDLLVLNYPVLYFLIFTFSLIGFNQLLFVVINKLNLFDQYTEQNLFIVIVICSSLSIVNYRYTKRKLKEIIENTKLSDGGGLTRILKELEESNFIRRYKAFGKKKNEGLYQLIDPYSLFYLRFIQHIDEEDESFWLNNIETPTFFNWAGYAFEMVCLHHLPQIKKALGIGGVQTSTSTWHSPDAQIDLVLDRKDQVINLFELKNTLTSKKCN